MAASNYYGFGHAGAQYGGISSAGNSNLDGTSLMGGFAQSAYAGAPAGYGTSSASRQLAYTDLFSGRSQTASGGTYDSYHSTVNDPLAYLAGADTRPVTSSSRFYTGGTRSSDYQSSSSKPFTGDRGTSSSSYSALRSGVSSSSGTASFVTSESYRGPNNVAGGGGTSHWPRKQFQSAGPRPRAPPKPSQLHYCEICRISCAGAQTYMEHLEGRNHKKKELLAKSAAAAASQGGAAGGSVTAVGNRSRNVYCELCDVACTCADTYAAHVRGTKHQKVLSLHQKLGKPIPEQKVPPVLDDNRSCMTAKSLLMAGTQQKSQDGGQFDESEVMDDSTAATNPDIQPVGLEYLEEGRNEAGTSMSFYCKLCDCHFTDPQAKYMHSKGRRHRLNYKVKVDPSLQVEMKPSPFALQVQKVEKVKRHVPMPVGLQYWHKRTLVESYRFEVDQLRYEQEVLKWQLTQASISSSVPVQPSVAGGSCFDTFSDRHIAAKHTAIYPTTVDLEAVQSVVSACEKALKCISDAMAKNVADTAEPAEEISEPTADVAMKTENTETKPLLDTDVSSKSKTATAALNDSERELKGVMRVGLLAKGLLLHGDLELQLVVLCNDRPTRTLLWTVAEALPQHLEAIAGAEKFEVKISEFGDGVNVQRVAEPRVSCNISFTSPAMKDELPLERAGEFLNRQMCLNMLAALRHTKWFQAKMSIDQNALVLVRILRDLCQRVPTWQPLGQWVLELLVEKCLSCCSHTISPAIGLRIVFEAIAAGILLPGGPGLLDPCEKDPVDAIAFLSRQQREDITVSAQHALRMIALGDIYRVLGMEALTPSAGPAGQRKRPRAADGVAAAAAGGLPPS